MIDSAWRSAARARDAAVLPHAHPIAVSAPPVVPSIPSATRAPTVARTIEIGEIVVELGTENPRAARPAAVEQAQAGSLLATIPMLRVAGGRR